MAEGACGAEGVNRGTAVMPPQPLKETAATELGEVEDLTRETLIERGPTGEDDAVQDLTVQDLTVQDFTVQDLTVQDLTVQDLTVQDPTVQDLTMGGGMDDSMTQGAALRRSGGRGGSKQGTRARNVRGGDSASEPLALTTRLRGLTRGRDGQDAGGTPGSRVVGGNPAGGLEGGIPGGAALHHAAAGGQAEVIKILLNYNADVRALDGRGRTPLHWAAAKGVADAVQALLVLGGLEPMAAAAEHSDNDGYTPLGIARALADAGSVQHVECVEILQRFSVQKAVEKARSRGGGTASGGGRIAGSSRRGRRNR